MGRAVTLLIDRELITVFGEHTGDDPPVFAQRATEQLAIREAKIAARDARSMQSRSGCAGGVSGCDVGRMHSRHKSDANIGVEAPVG